MTICMIRNLVTLFVFLPEVLEAETSSTYKQEKNVSTAQKWADSLLKLDSLFSILENFEDRGSRIESSIETLE